MKKIELTTNYGKFYYVKKISKNLMSLKIFKYFDIFLNNNKPFVFLYSILFSPSVGCIS